MIRRMAASILVLAAIAVGADEAARTYLKGTITGFETRLHDKNRRTKVYELKGADRIYQVDICGSLQAGKYAPGQQVEYRVAGQPAVHTPGRQSDKRIQLPDRRIPNPG